MAVSMTGFARCSKEAVWGTLTWEIRSVNHRFLELSVRMPESLRLWEVAIRESIQKMVGRGKVDAMLRFTPGVQVPFDLMVNSSLLQQLAQAVNTVSATFPNSVVNPLEVLGWQGVLETKHTHMEQVAHAALALLQESLVELVAVRAREGANIKTFMQERIRELHRLSKVIEQHIPRIQQQVRDKVLMRFAELNLEYNSERLEQEMVWLVQKMDIAEELHRLDAHVTEVEHTLQRENDSIGRRLDFLMQELNRETNTVGSKSVDSAVTQLVVEMKVQIEQMREQVQNIE